MTFKHFNTFKWKSYCGVTDSGGHFIFFPNDQTVRTQTTALLTWKGAQGFPMAKRRGWKTNQRLGCVKKTLPPHWHHRAPVWWAAATNPHLSQARPPQSWLHPTPIIYCIHSFDSERKEYREKEIRKEGDTILGMRGGKRGKREVFETLKRLNEGRLSNYSVVPALCEAQLWDICENYQWQNGLNRG